MNLMEIMNSITNLGGQIRQANGQLASMAMDHNVAMADVENKQAEIADMQKRLSALQASYNAMKGNAAGGLQPVGGQQQKTRCEILKSNEYARAFLHAIRNGLNRRSAMGDEKCKVLFDALTEGGGSPAGTDGGFLVPEDIDNTINEVRRELNPLANYFNVETVSTDTGWRVMDTMPTAAMPSVDEMGTIVNNGDQPAFAKVTYNLTKYGLRIPISNELLQDEDANLMAYLGRWFGKKQVITENSLLITALKTLTASALVSGSDTADAGIKTVLNKVLDPAISAGAVIITNQTGFNELDQLVDDMGRGLLQPDPTNATMHRIFARPVVVLSDTMLPNTTEGTETVTTKAEFFIGDMHDFATLFTRSGLEIATTDIGGNAWATDSTEVRGLSRMCVSKFDTAAAVRRQLTIS